MQQLAVLLWFLRERTYFSGETTVFLGGRFDPTRLQCTATTVYTSMLQELKRFSAAGQVF